MNKENCKHPTLWELAGKHGLRCPSCGKWYPYDSDLYFAGYKYIGVAEYQLTSTDIKPALTSTDGRYAILCPFHEEKVASCILDPKENRYKCLSCGAEGKADELEIKDCINQRTENGSPLICKEPNE